MIAEAAHILHTPIGALEDMDWARIVAYHAQALRILKARQGEV